MTYEIMDDLMKSCVKKSKLYKTFRKSNTIVHKEQYIAYRNKLKILLRSAEKKYYSDQFSKFKGNMHQTWKVIGSILNQKNVSKIAKSFNIGGTNVTCAREITEKFNEYFTNVGRNLASTIPVSQKSFKNYLSRDSNKNSIFFFPTTPFEIVNIVTKLESKTSCGVDGIPINILKATTSLIAEPISALINCSLSSGVVPDKLKIGRISPVYKNGEKNYFQTIDVYLCILPSFSKVYEKVVAVRLRSFIAFV